MNAASLLSELRVLGVQLTLDGDDIAYRAPKGALAPEQLESLQANKQAIVRELRSEFDNADVPSEFRNVNTVSNHKHPFGRFVEPVKTDLLARVGLERNYIRGEGCYLWDVDGIQYLDCVAQYGGLPFGYNPPQIWAAIERVRDQSLPNITANSLLDSAGELAERLIELAPAGMRHVIFCNSGAETTEIAIKLCRSALDRPGILSTRHGFHGLTTGSLAATGSDPFQSGFFVRGDSYEHVPFGDSHAVQQALESRPGHFAAFLVEPIQGEAGIIVPPDGYLSRVREICDRFDVLLVVDEVQTGLGRTGRMFACDHENVIPDVITLAKALGGGLMPIGAVLCQPKAYSAQFGLRHSSTFAGNAIACQAALATLDALTANNQRLVDHVSDWGAYLSHGLKNIQDRYPDLVKDVRGRGFMRAVEFDFGALNGRSGLLPILAEQQLLPHLITSYLLREHQVRVAPSFMGRNLLRIEPPLIAGKSECDQLLGGLNDVLRVIQSGNSAALVAGMIPDAPIGQDASNGVSDRSVSDRSMTHRAKANHSEFIESRRKAFAVQRPGPTVRENSIKGEFGFLVHLSSLQDLVTFDPSLSVFSEKNLSDLRKELTRSAAPPIVGSADFKSRLDYSVRGHFVLVPFTPKELLRMPLDEAVRQIRFAAEVAADTGAPLIGLGGFTSILTHGGLALDGCRLPPLTSGNAYTVAAAVSAIRQSSDERSVQLQSATVAVVGAAGQIGRALSLILSQDAERLILVGRDGTENQTRRGLRNIARCIAEHLQHPSSGDGPIKTFVAKQIAAIAAIGAVADTAVCVEKIAERLVDAGILTIATDIEEIRSAEIIVAASSAVEPIIGSSHIQREAIVCDCSRPANVDSRVVRERSDVKWIAGGLVRIPGMDRLDLFTGPLPHSAYACVAEAALRTLEPSLGSPSPTRLLDITEIQALEGAGRKHGFEFIV